MWMQEDIKILKENHGRLTLPQINNLLSDKKSYSCIRSCAQRLGLFRDNSKFSLPIKNFHDMKYWEMPNLINSYIAGLIAGDGCIKKAKNGFMKFAYKCSIKDESIIDLLIKELKFTGKKGYCEHPSPHYPDRISKFVSIQITGGFDYNAEKLKEHFNLEPNKTFRLGPTNLYDNNLNFAYIIGLIDSDGSIETGFRLGKYRKFDVSFNSCSLDILEWVKIILDREFPSLNLKRVAKIRKSKNYNVYQYYVCGARAAIILDYLSKFPVPKLARKWETPQFKETMQYFKTRYPQHFTNIPDFSSVNPIISSELSNN